MLLALFAVAHWTPLLPWIDRAVVAAMGPVVRPLGEFARALGRYGSSLGRQSQLLAERDARATEVAKLNAAVSGLQIVARENALLRAQLKFTEDTNYPTVVARPIARVRDGDHTVIMVNQGAKSGVGMGMPVLSPEGALIGKVIKVNPGTSFVQLVTDPASVFAAVVARNDQAKGLMRGENNLSVLMDMIPIDQVIAVGDIVVTAGIEPEIPRGILIGTVNGINETPGGILKSAQVTPAADLNNVHLLTIVKVVP